ncbi:MAG: T9SS type A sorting domain-containing protein, partial [Ignavibacteria bacterium]|nr:T9SS type A sorting domain-containing protein [Ignavibacteria bacterium]
DMNGITGVLPEKANIRVNGLPRIDVDNSGGTRHNWIYIVTGERGITPAGNDADILLHRSTDRGASWSAGIRVNQDPLNNGKLQYFPVVHVDQGGGVNVLYYDDRTTTSDSASVFLSRSTDGGSTWSDYEVSDHHFKPLPIGGLGQGYQGDNIGLSSVGDTLWAVWMDNSTGIYQVWASPIDLESLGTSVDQETALPFAFGLAQNYPNPFNPGTTIPYQIPRASIVTLTIYDVLGREIATVVNEPRGPGFHEAKWDASDHASGVYYYRLKAFHQDGGESGGFVETKKLLLVR